MPWDNRQLYGQMDPGMTTHNMGSWDYYAPQRDDQFYARRGEASLGMPNNSWGYSAAKAVAPNITAAYYGDRKAQDIGSIIQDLGQFIPTPSQGAQWAAAPLIGGGTRIIKSGGPRGVGYVEAFNDATKAVTGKLGFRYAEGMGPRMNDIVVKPEARGQGYAKEMVDAFTDHFAPEMQKAGFSGNITESPGYWAKLRDQMSGAYPKLSQGIDYALTERYPDFSKWGK